MVLLRSIFDEKIRIGGVLLSSWHFLTTYLNMIKSYFLTVFSKLSSKKSYLNQTQTSVFGHIHIPVCIFIITKLSGKNSPFFMQSAQ